MEKIEDDDVPKKEDEEKQPEKERKGFTENVFGLLSSLPFRP